MTEGCRMTPAHPLRFLQFRARIVNHPTFWQADFTEGGVFRSLRSRGMAGIQQIQRFRVRKAVAGNANRLGLKSEPVVDSLSGNGFPARHWIGTTPSGRKQHWQLT